MADQIIVLDRREVRFGRLEPRLLFRVLALYDLGASPIRDTLGAAVVVRSSGEIEPSVRAYLTAPEIAAIDAGSLGWEFHEVLQLAGESLGDVAARARAAFPGKKALWIAREQGARANFGTRLSP